MSRTNDNLLSLFSDVFGDRASAEQMIELERLLAEDPNAVELYALYAQQDIDLRHTLATEGMNFCGAHSNAAMLVSKSSREPASSSPVSAAKITSSVRLLIAMLACAAALLISVTVSHVPKKPIQRPMVVVRQDAAAGQTAQQPRLNHVVYKKPPAPIGVLMSANDVVWRGRKSVAGQSLREGDEVSLVRGEIRISMGFGAEIAAKGPCALRLVARDRVRLLSGEVAVHVAEWAHGFAVETPSMEVIDLGTTFVVSASKDNSAETSVIEGQVRVSPHKKIEGGPRSVLVSAGETLMVESTGRRSSIPTKPGDAIAYVDFGVEQPFRPIGLHNSGYGFDIGDEDPHWRVVRGPEGSFSGPQFAMVCVPDERYMPNDPRTSQWVSMVNWRTASPDSLYTFETSFDLTGFELSTVQLFGRFLADNGIKQVRVNGKAVTLQSWVDNVSGQYFLQPQFRTVNVSSGLTEGVNTIEIDVWNERFQPLAKNRKDPNPMALRVEWEGFGRPKFENDLTGTSEKQAQLARTRELALEDRAKIVENWKHKL